MIVLLDIIGCISGIFGAILVGQINKLGYLLFMICNLSYGTLGILQNNYGLVLVSIVMFYIDVKYYIKWGKNEK